MVILLIVTRILWIVGLSFALFVFGGWTILIALAGLTHRHLNAKGLMMFWGNGYIAWLVFQYLREKIREPKSNSVQTSNSE